MFRSTHVKRARDADNARARDNEGDPSMQNQPTKNPPAETYVGSRRAQILALIGKC